MPFLIGPIADLINTVISKVWPDPLDQAKAKTMLMTAEQNGELEELKTRLSAIMAEAHSPDPWTSRARPAFMYVIYIMLLMAIPMGFLSAYDPAIANNVATGFKAWLAAIPDSLYTLYVFLELSCFFDDSAFVGNLVSG